MANFHEGILKRFNAKMLRTAGVILVAAGRNENGRFADIMRVHCQLGRPDNSRAASLFACSHGKNYGNDHGSIPAGFSERLKIISIRTIFSIWKGHTPLAPQPRTEDRKTAGHQYLKALRSNFRRELPPSTSPSADNSGLKIILRGAIRGSER